MGRNQQGEQNIRKIQQSHGTYYVTIPIDQINDLGWQEHQRVDISREGETLVIKDYED